MNDTIKTLLNRRSIRKYKPEQIKEEELNLILEAGKYAPSGMNKQASLFVVVQNKEMIKKISKMNAAVMNSDMDPYYGAPTVVLVFADKTAVTYIEDGALALGNMYNAAYSLGIGSCWIHRTKQMFETEEGKALLKEWKVEDKYVGIGSCILGYTEGEHPAAAKRKDNFVIMVK